MAGMRVASVRTFLVDPGVGKNWLFVRLETDDGVVGWGECYTQADRDRSIESHVEELGRYLVGWSPFAIKHFTHIAYRDFATKRGSMDFFCALSGIEQALWDVVGKAAASPSTTCSAARAAAASDQRFTALKLDPFTGPWRTHISRTEEDAAVECVRAEPHFVAVSPHNYNSTTVALAATAQASAVMPNFLITEYWSFRSPAEEGP